MPAPIVPAPPLATQGLPWHAAVDDAVAAIGEARREHGDTFATCHGRDRYLFTFTAAGVEAFYALPEDVASKGVADYLMLRRKLPDELFDGRRTLPGTLFRRGDVAVYLATLESALDATLAELGASGEVDVFDLTRRLGHRLGLASWAGAAAASGAAFERLVAAFDVLDGSDAFVHPDAMAAVAASGKAAETAALEEVVAVVGPLPPDDGLFGRVRAAWADEPDEDARRRGIGLDVALLHVASMSNLHAALGWALVDLAAHPDAVDRVRSGDADFTGRCALESTRLAQRSIMARTVLAPVSFSDGVSTYDVPPGWTIATLLPLLNTSAAPGLQDWDPDRWDRNRLRPVDGLASPQLVTAFGHGRHTCPAQPFSLAAMSTAMTRLVAAYDLEPRWTTYPAPVAAQIGGVARAAGPVPIGYAAR
ncbi:hypothetical protein [Nocardioides sp.]|uniref:hypothetical protein n=1 Tax=Nocardioides sp. TaxID=35761 RepID=UPI002724FB26|nr:hypothetical protein [Nocardioides sp.]MDO9458357.1 hypothetical protein [Nocardioides sp.]